MFIHERGSFCRSLGYLLLVTTWIVAGSSGSEINETQEVTSLMDKLFDDNNACGTPAMELGFLVPGSYNEPQEENEITFRKALHFVKKMAQQIKLSDSGTHVGLVVYGKKPYMAFDFNEYFDLSSLSEAIEEVKTPVVGSKIGEALSFAKDQLYDKSARPEMPKALIVLMSKRSEDTIDHAVKALKTAGVKIYTVGIGGEGDPLEMSDMASDVQNTFVSDDSNLDSLVTKLVPKLCEAPEVGKAADNPDAPMNPHEEPGPGTSTISEPNAQMPSAPQKPSAMIKEVHMPRKLATSHDAEENKGMEMEDSPPNADSFEDAMNDAPSHHFDIFDLLSNASGQANGTVGVSNQTTDMNSEEPETTPEEGAGVEEETVDAEESTSSTQNSSDNNSSMIAKKNTSSTSDKRVRLKDLANKICSAKADIGILIDGSSSVTQAKFAKLLDFTNSLVKSFSVSQDRTHIAVATASRGPHMSFDFRGFNDVPSITTAISRISYNGGPFLLGSSLTGVKTSWFKNSGRKSIPQLLLVLATSSSIDDIVAPSRVMRDRGVRIESVGIGTGFNGAQLKEMATHPARDHVMAVSKFDLLPMIRPLLTFRMCRAVGGKLISKPTSDQSQNEPPIVPNTQNTVDKQPVINSNKVQHLPKSNQVKQEKQINPDTQAQKNKLAATLKQLDQYKLIQKQSSSEESSQQQDDEIENEKIRKDIRLKLYSLLRRLGGTKKDIRAAYRSIIYNINGHHDSVNCKDTHSLCGQWAADNLCDKGNDTIDSQSVQRVCPKSCKVCY
ncbi:collagen alpha-1(XII) chain-like isoform X4 [Oculina patagonica]